MFDFRDIMVFLGVKKGSGKGVIFYGGIGGGCLYNVGSRVRH